MRLTRARQAVLATTKQQLPDGIVPEELERQLVQHFHKRIKSLNCDYHPQAKVIRECIASGEHLPPFILKNGNAISAVVEFRNGYGASIAVGWTRDTFDIVTFEVEHGSRDKHVIDALELKYWSSVIAVITKLLRPT